MDLSDDGAYVVRSVQRVCDVLDLLRVEPEGLSLNGIVELTGVPKSSIFRYLSNLEARQYVERDPVTGDYRPGISLLSMAGNALEALKRRVAPHLVRLRDEFGETANFGILDGSCVLYAAVAESSRGVRLAAQEGDQDPVHSTAMGKAIASQLKKEHVVAILEANGMPSRTPNTIVDAESFHKEVAQVRAKGYALDDRENEPDGRCIGVPVTGISIPAALSLAAPASRLRFDSVDELASIADSLRSTASTIADEIGFVPQRSHKG